MFAFVGCTVSDSTFARLLGTLALEKIWVQCAPRSVVRYTPPMLFPKPFQPLKTQTYHVFCAASFGSITTSFVQYFMLAWLTSLQAPPWFVLTKTPLLAVKLLVRRPL